MVLLCLSWPTSLMKTWNRTALEGLAWRRRRRMAAEPQESSQALHPTGSSFPSSPRKQWWAITFALEYFYETMLNPCERISTLCILLTAFSLRLGFKFVWTLTLQKLLLKAFQNIPDYSRVQVCLTSMVQMRGKTVLCTFVTAGAALPCSRQAIETHLLGCRSLLKHSHEKEKM